MKVAQQLTCLTLGRPNGLAYSTSELLNTPLDNGMDMMKTQPEGGGGKNGFITVMPMNVEFVDGVYKLYFVLVVKHVRIQTCKLVLSCECVAFYACNVYF